MATGPSWSVPIWVVRATRKITVIGAAMSAAGTAANIVANASPSGSPGISKWAAVPAVPPMNSMTRTGPPMNPVASQSANTRIFELSPLRDPYPEPAADLAQCVLRPKACPADQRYKRDGNRLQGRARLDPLVLEFLHRPGQLGREPENAPQHADEHTGGCRHCYPRPRGHRGRP